MKWKPFQHDGITFDLTHLHPRTFRFERPAEGEKPAETYIVETIFTSHCFTRGVKDGEVYDKQLVYTGDDYEERLFDARRYELSKRLPAIIEALPRKKPYHNSNRRNFFTIELITDDGQTIEYDIFFKVKKLGKGKLEMIVETAFVRDPAYQSSRPTGKPIRFWIILHNTLHGIKIKS